MSIFLWVLQVLLALWNLIGGSYVISHYENLKGAWAADLPQPVWVAYGVLQILSALGLFWPKAVPIAAVVLSVFSLLGCALFARYAGFPGMLWGVLPAILTAFIAYGRFVLKPFSGRKP